MAANARQTQLLCVPRTLAAPPLRQLKLLKLYFEYICHYLRIGFMDERFTFAIHPWHCHRHCCHWHRHRHHHHHSSFITHHRAAAKYQSALDVCGFAPGRVCARDVATPSLASARVACALLLRPAQVRRIVKRGLLGACETGSRSLSQWRSVLALTAC